MESSARKILSPLHSEPRCALPSLGSANRHFTENHSARDFPKFFPALKKLRLSDHKKENQIFC